MKVGEGISGGNDEEPQEINNPMNNQNDLEDQPVGNNIEDKEHSMKEEEHPTDEEHPTSSTTTVSGWVSKPLEHLINEIREAPFTATERNYYFALGELLEENECGCIGMGIGSGIDNTNEL